MSSQIRLTIALQDYIRRVGLREDAGLAALREAINQKVHDDNRVDAALLPIGDGLTLALKL